MTPETVVTQVVGSVAPTPPARGHIDETIAGGRFERADVIWTQPGFEPYQRFTGVVESPHMASTSQLIDGIASVLSVEGPMLGHCLFLAYVRASGGRRTSPQTVEAIESALKSAVRRGVVVVDNPLAERATRMRTYRLPTQPEVRVRELGGRTI